MGRCSPALLLASLGIVFASLAASGLGESMVQPALPVPATARTYDWLAIGVPTPSGPGFRWGAENTEAACPELDVEPLGLMSPGGFPLVRLTGISHGGGEAKATFLFPDYDLDLDFETTQAATAIHSPSFELVESGVYCAIYPNGWVVGYASVVGNGLVFGCGGIGLCHLRSVAEP